MRSRRILLGIMTFLMALSFTVADNARNSVNCGFCPRTCCHCQNCLLWNH